MPRWNFDFSGKPRPDFTFPQVDFNQPRGQFNLGTNNPQPVDFRQQTPQTPMNRSAYDRFMEVSNEMPVYGDKEYQLGKWGKLGSVLAGMGSTALSGDVNQGLGLTKTLLNKKFDTAVQEWGNRYKTAEAAAKEERLFNEQTRKDRNTDAQTELYGAQKDKLETETRLAPEESAALVKSRLANANHDTVSAEKILRDMQNPELFFQKNNRGGLDFFNKQTGEIVKSHENINLSDEELKQIDFRHDQSLTAQRGREARLTVGEQNRGLKDLSRQSFFQNAALSGFKQEGQEKLLDKRLEAAKTKGDAQQRLTDPQYQREFISAATELRNMDPEIKELIDEHYTMDTRGRLIPRDPDNMETLDVFNRIQVYMNRKKATSK